MKKVKINLEKSSYDFVAGKKAINTLPQFLKKTNSNGKVFFIVDANVDKYYVQLINTIAGLSGLEWAYYILKSGESSKNYNELNKIYEFLLNEGADRKSTIAAVGGGVTGDLAGYAASTFMRGIGLIHIPTTLLAMVDSSIGGKTGINFSLKKNMVGTFYQPTGVFADINFLKTLPEPEIISGMGEIIKYAFLLDKNFFDFVENKIDKISHLDENVTSKTVYECASIKAAVVAEDEKEKGLRKILNLGHTFAHAYESNLNFNVKHGEAVIAGIISAVFLSKRLKFITDAQLPLFLNLLGKVKLSGNFVAPDKEKIYKIMQHDKKNTNGKIKFILPKDIGVMLMDIEAGKRDIFYALDAVSSFIEFN